MAREGPHSDYGKCEGTLRPPKRPGGGPHVADRVRVDIALDALPAHGGHRGREDLVPRPADLREMREAVAYSWFEQTASTA